MSDMKRFEKLSAEQKRLLNQLQTTLDTFKKSNKIQQALTANEVNDNLSAIWEEFEFNLTETEKFKLR